VRVVNDDVMSTLHLPASAIDAVAAEETRELLRRQQMYRGDRPFPPLTGKIVIVVDDGLATGSSMRAAVQALRQHHPARIVIAVPVAAADTCDDLRRDVDEVVCAMTPDPFRAVGLWYGDFSETSDDEVRELLTRQTG